MSDISSVLEPCLSYLNFTLILKLLEANEENCFVNHGHVFIQKIQMITLCLSAPGEHIKSSISSTSWTFNHTNISQRSRNGILQYFSQAPIFRNYIQAPSWILPQPSPKAMEPSPVIRARQPQQHNWEWTNSIPAHRISRGWLRFVQCSLRSYGRGLLARQGSNCKRWCCTFEHRLLICCQSGPRVAFAS